MNQYVYTLEYRWQTMPVYMWKLLYVAESEQAAKDYYELLSRATLNWYVRDDALRARYHYDGLSKIIESIRIKRREVIDAAEIERFRAARKLSAA